MTLIDYVADPPMTLIDYVADPPPPQKHLGPNKNSMGRSRDHFYPKQKCCGREHGRQNTSTFITTKLDAPVPSSFVII